MFLEVLSQSKCVITVPLTSETESLESLKEEEGSKGIQGRSEVTEELSPNFNCKRDGSKCFAKFKTVVPFSWFGESRKLPRSRPVESACMKN